MAFAQPKILQTIPGVPFDVGFQGLVITPGTNQDLITHIVSTGQTVNLLQVVIACRMEGKFTILKDATIIGTGRTGAATPNAPFWFVPFKIITGPATIKVQFKSRTGFSPNTVDVEAYLQATLS